jgi:uncharacterized protein YndB with AHSA1/START domain
MLEYEESIEIDAPPERVWAVLSDVERWPEWTASMTTVERLDEGPLALGSRARVKQPHLRPVEMTVTELDEGRSFAWTNTQPGVTTLGDHRVEPLGEGRSRATLILRQHGFATPLIKLFYDRMIRRYVRMEAEGLKQRAEG